MWDEDELQSHVYLAIRMIGGKAPPWDLDFNQSDRYRAIWQLVNSIYGDCLVFG